MAAPLKPGGGPTWSVTVMTSAAGLLADCRGTAMATGRRRRRGESVRANFMFMKGSGNEREKRATYAQVLKAIIHKSNQRFLYAADIVRIQK